MLDVKNEVGVTFHLTVLGSGSAGNCSLVGQADDLLLIDAGFSGKEICARMERAGQDPNRLKGIVVTHEHSDHIRSAHTLSRRLEVPIYCTEGTYLSAFRDKNFFDWVEIKPGRHFQVGKMDIHPISLPHDAEDPVGLRIEAEGKTIGHLTDFGYVSGLIKACLKGCDVLLIEANHDVKMLKDGPYPWSLKQRIASRLGHLSNEALFEFLPEILDDKLKHVFFGHLSETNNNPHLVRLLMKQALYRLGLTNLSFSIASQNEPSDQTFT